MNRFIEYLEEEIKALNLDLKAEVVAADLLHHQDIEQDEVFFQNMSLKRRAYSKDIHAAIVPNEGDLALVIQTNREGIYDALPEALTHKPFQSKNFKRTSDLLDEIKVHKIEEQQARRFFAPFENELQHLRLNIEQNERKSLDVFNNKSIVSIFYKLWGGTVLNLSQEQLSILFILLPHIDQIKAAPELISFCYSKLLNDTIVIQIHSKKSEYDISLLEGSILGSEFTCGAIMELEEIIYKVAVQLSSNSRIDEYMPGGLKHKMILFFNDYFIPYNSEFVIEILKNPDKDDLKTLFVVGDSFLDANTYI